MGEKLAEQGWLVRVETMDAAAVMDFAVGKNSSREAIAAVLDHPQSMHGTGHLGRSTNPYRNFGL